MKSKWFDPLDTPGGFCIGFLKVERVAWNDGKDGEDQYCHITVKHDTIGTLAIDATAEGLTVTIHDKEGVRQIL